MSKAVNPIFIHSLFRAGSTYIFNAFRRADEQYWCYQEPFNEYLLNAKNAPDQLLELGSGKAKELNHPKLNKPYFYEFHLIADDVSKTFKKGFVYDQYFSENKSGALRDYLELLSNNAKGQPVFQFCRSAGRVETIKSICGGVHIFLWRNPWNQWWSYQIDQYFDRANLLILNARDLPPVFARLRESFGLEKFHSDNISEELEFFSKRSLSPENSYKLFYALWCHSFLEAQPHCDLSINIDELAGSTAYRSKVQSDLVSQGVNGIDFSDSKLPDVAYDDDEIDRFFKIEQEIHELFTLDEQYIQDQISELESLSENRRSAGKKRAATKNQNIADAINTRKRYWKYMIEISGAKHERLELERQLRISKSHIDDVQNSTSWRVTQPLRSTSETLKSLYMSVKKIKG